MPEEEIQSCTAITTAEYNKIKAKADRLDELLVIYKRHYGNVIEYALELQEKAEKWDEVLQNKDSPLQLTTKYIRIENKLEAFKKLFKKGPYLNVDTLEECHQAIDDWLGKLMNFLEAED